MEQQISLASFQIYQFMLLVRHKLTNVYYRSLGFVLYEILICTSSTTKITYEEVYYIYVYLYLLNFVGVLGGTFMATCRL